jgi:hypothetical protein
VQARQVKQPEPESDKDGLFGRQIAANLKRLEGQTEALCKLKIQQILLEAECGSSLPEYQAHGSGQYLHLRVTGCVKICLFPMSSLPLP